MIYSSETLMDCYHTTQLPLKIVPVVTAMKTSKTICTLHISIEPLCSVKSQVQNIIRMIKTKGSGTECEGLINMTWLIRLISFWFDSCQNDQGSQSPVWIPQIYKIPCVYIGQSDCHISHRILQQIREIGVENQWLATTENSGSRPNMELNLAKQALANITLQPLIIREATEVVNCEDGYKLRRVWSHFISNCILKDMGSSHWIAPYYIPW